MAYAYDWIEGQDLTPGSNGSWVETDISAYVPSTAVLAVLRIYNLGATNDIIGHRSAETSDDVKSDLFAYTQMTVYCPIGVGKKIDLYVENKTNNKVYLIGYLTSDICGVVHDPLSYELSPTVGDYRDVDLSSIIPSGAEAVILRAEADSYYYFGTREKGSTDTPYNQMGTIQGGFIVGVDGDRVCQINRESTNLKIYIVGWILDGGGSLFANGVLINPTGFVGVYESLDYSGYNPPVNMLGAVVRVSILFSTPADVALRPDGYSFDVYERVGLQGGIHLVRMVDSKIEVKRASTNIHFYLLGFVGGLAAIDTSGILPLFRPQRS